MSFVVDSSIALSWLLPDERGAPAEDLIERLTTAGAVAPPLWWLEVGNGLTTAQRRGRLSVSDVDRALDLLAALPIAIDAEATVRLVDGLIALARKHGLTTYDACYLELAKRRGWPLATLDTKLRTACAAEGIAVL